MDPKKPHPDRVFRKTNPSKKSSSKPPLSHIPTLRLRLIQLFVLPYAPPPSHNGRDNRQPTSRDNYSPTRLVSRLLRPKEEVGREPVRDGGDAIGYGDQRGTFCSGTWDDGGFPGDLYLINYLDVSIVPKLIQQGLFEGTGIDLHSIQHRAPCIAIPAQSIARQGSTLRS